MRRPRPRTAFCAIASADAHDVHGKKGSELCYAIRKMTDADRTVVRGPLCVPVFDEGAGADGESVAAVSVADCENLAGHGCGTGIALSKRCPDVPRALDYALFTGSAAVQAGIYTLAGGQPSRREAWADPSLEPMSGDFFRDARHD